MTHFKISDRLIAERVYERIYWDKRVSTSDVQILVEHGKVILTGSVDCPLKRDAAVEVAGATEGVLEVESQIRTPLNFYRTDGEIRGMVLAELKRIGLLEDEFINVAVMEGVVKLDGIVLRAQAKAAAAGIVWELSGVKDCLNFIDISEPPRSKQVHVSAPSRKRSPFLEGLPRVGRLSIA